MHVLSYVLPKNIREGSIYKFLNIEQKGENLHFQLNKYERDLLPIKNWPTRYLMMVKKVENSLKAKKKCPELLQKPMVRVYKKEVQCLLCDKVFKHKGTLTMHKKVHQILP